MFPCLPALSSSPALPVSMLADACEAMTGSRFEVGDRFYEGGIH